MVFTSQDLEDNWRALLGEETTSPAIAVTNRLGNEQNSTEPVNGNAAGQSKGQVG